MIHVDRAEGVRLVTDRPSVAVKLVDVTAVGRSGTVSFPTFAEALYWAVNATSRDGVDRLVKTKHARLARYHVEADTKVDDGDTFYPVITHKVWSR
jgi:hypothetical protein